MKVILRDDITGLGGCGDVVEVKNGYARNYLIPRDLAIKATKSTLKAIEEIKKQKRMRDNKKARTMELLAEKIEKISCTAAVAVGEEDRVFGSVTSQTISDLLKEKGFEIERKKILLEEPIKALGVYSIPIKLDSEVTARLKLWVVKK